MIAEARPRSNRYTTCTEREILSITAGKWHAIFADRQHKKLYRQTILFVAAVRQFEEVRDRADNNRVIRRKWVLDELIPIDTSDRWSDGLEMADGDEYIGLIEYGGDPFDPEWLLEIPDFIECPDKRRDRNSDRASK
ncbi:hypothetical protein U8335_11405 [Roseiconus lacunae]|uniref:hypothetical protein n=1 Tax=Roseiconus lacunae TaxID=2605694 RepID=UPI0030909248|nr:hypothetical protein U8335_11405 [Stieleria sp. HD01]